MKKVDAQLACEIANSNLLTIWQDWQSPLDFITPILTSPDIKMIKDKILNFAKDPVLYYGVQEDNSYYFINYIVYHPFDWADHKFFIKGIRDWLNKADSHRHDTESICIRVNKKSRVRDICTVAHFSHRFAWKTSLDVSSESESHALTPFKDADFSGRMPVVYTPGSYRIENFMEWSDYKLLTIKKLLKQQSGGRVNWIDTQFDVEMRQATAGGFLKKRGQHMPGDIINDPAKLFRIAKRLGR